jgi:hypothetical protein
MLLYSDLYATGKKTTGFFPVLKNNYLPFISCAQGVEVVLALWFIHRLSWPFPAIGNIKTGTATKHSITQRLCHLT